MARTPVLGGGGLSPFGGGGVNFGSFNVVDPGREAYLSFLKVKVDWEQGKIANATYLGAFATYVAAQTPGSSTRIDAEQSLRDTTYRLERNDLLAGVEAGTKSWAQLLTYDKAKLAGLDHGSQEYLDRVNLYQQTQAKALSDAASLEHDLYDAGKLTTSQLRGWYRQQAMNPLYADNPDLADNITKQIRALDLRVTSEVDNHMIESFNQGKIGNSTFLVYAAAAKGRYEAGTEQARQWTDLITNAKAQIAEKGLTYRYGLSQRYIDLQKFIKDNTDMLARAGTGSSSTSTRIVLGADGQWKTVTSTKSSPYKPSTAEQKAMSDRRIELADAKRQLAEVNHKVGAAGGYVTTGSMISFYTGRQATFSKGSPEWYQVQERLDGLQQQQHQEQVLRAEGVHVIYGGGSAAAGHAATGSAPRAASRAIGVDAFMRSVAVTESGGNYNATNKSSGAYGKYQIMPANWPSWAAKYLGDGSLQPTPDNQEKVARGKMLDLYKSLGSWDLVAHWWLTGNGRPDRENWSTSSAAYVNGIMGRLGSAPIVASRAPLLGTVGAAARDSGSVGHQSPAPATSRKGPLEVVTGQTAARRGAPHLVTARANFPTNLDGSAFTKFYSGFVGAFKDGQTTFTDFSSGRAITYAIPGDPTARITMMSALDDLRISYYAKRAEVYAGTPSEFAAAHEYSEAIKDKADNAYTILVTAPPKGYATTGHPVVDPIALGLAARDKAEEYVSAQLAAAKLAYARGDVTGAYSHIQLAQKTLAETDVKLRAYTAAADAQMTAIAKASGEKAPTAVATDFSALVDWQSSASLTKSLTDMDKLQGEIIGDPAANRPGTAATDAHGNVVWSAGQVQLRDGTAAFLDPAGKVTFQDVPSAGYQKPGSNAQVPDVPGYVAVTINNGGSVVGDQSGGTTVYAKWTTGVVGYTSSGAPITGKIVSGTLNGKRYTYGEDPFHPGKWSAGNLTFAVPDGFKAVPGATAGSTVYQFTGKDGALYRLDWDPAGGAYNVVKAGSLFGGQDQYLPITDADTQALLDGSGFRVDLSSVAPDDQWQFNMNGAHPGFSKADWTAFTTPRPDPSVASSRPRIAADPRLAWERTDMARLAASPSGSPDDRQARNDQLRAAAARSMNLPGSTHDERDDNYAARQIARQNEIPDVSMGARDDAYAARQLSSIPAPVPRLDPHLTFERTDARRDALNRVAVKPPVTPAAAPASKTPPKPIAPLPSITPPKVTTTRAGNRINF